MSLTRSSKWNIFVTSYWRNISSLASLPHRTVSNSLIRGGNQKRIFLLIISSETGTIFYFSPFLFLFFRLFINSLLSFSVSFSCSIILHFYLPSALSFSFSLFSSPFLPFFSLSPSLSLSFLTKMYFSAHTLSQLFLFSALKSNWPSEIRMRSKYKEMKKRREGK